MKESKIFTTEIGGRKVEVEIGGYCGQSNGECFVKCDGTVVMNNVTMAASPREGMDFFPLGCDFEEKLYAIGKIPGGFKKREGRPSDKAILTSRLIDRPLRPMFPKGMYNDVAVVATALSVNPDCPPEVYAMLGTSIALCISDIPFAGPTAAVIVGMVDGKYVINPNSEQRDRSRLHLSLAGTKDAILMVEAGADIISEEEMLQAILFGHEEIKKICAFVEDIVKEVGKEKTDVYLDVASEELATAVKEYVGDRMDYVFDTTDRHERQKREDEITEEVQEHFAEIYPDQAKYIDEVLYKMKKATMRANIIDKGIRADGRKLDEIRPIWCEAGVLPRTHGSAVFTRGETQVLNVCTLGTISEVQKLEGLDDEVFKRYMHHYNFPPYSTGEARPLKSPGRREIGHGALAERALLPVIPSESEFPYAIRTVSEVLSSNGSSSMASVCGSTMSLMDAGVPLKAPVAGVAMGLIKDEEKGKVAILTDIQGLEDFLGDMDFKVAGTKDGITAIQMDIKIKGIDENILRTALEQAKIGRMKIMQQMLDVIPEPRKELSPYAPKIITFAIDVDKIKDVIGSGGKVINKIIEQTGVKIDIDDDGNVFVSSVDLDACNQAKKIIELICKDPEKNDVIEGEVKRIMSFGAFVEYAPGKEGLIHISKLSKDRVEKVEDVVNIGDRVTAKVIKIDDKGRVDLKLVEKL